MRIEKDFFYHLANEKGKKEIQSYPLELTDFDNEIYNLVFEKVRKNKIHAIVFIHPEFNKKGFELLESETQPHVEIYHNNLRLINSYATDLEIPIFTIPEDINNYEQNFPKEVLSKSIMLDPESFIDTNIALKIISSNTNVNTNNLEVILGGMFYDDCVAAFGKRAFEKYFGPEVYHKKEDIANPKGYRADVIKSLTRWIND